MKPVLASAANLAETIHEEPKGGADRLVKLKRKLYARPSTQ